MPRNRMTHASLFSGIGGAEIAAGMMGWENAFHCEIQEFPRRVLEYWYPNSRSYEDITKTDFTPWKGKIDILTGGFPCQPFSCAGKRKGADDDRYLWPEMLRAIRQIQPSWVVGENVAGILTMVQPGSEFEMGSESTIFGEDNEIWERRQQYVVETVCQDLEREGYSVQPFVVPACAVGAPHRRDRVWFVARRVAADTRGHGGQTKAKRRYRTTEKTHEQFEPVFDREIAADLSDGRDFNPSDRKGTELFEREGSGGCRQDWVAADSDGKLQVCRDTERPEGQQNKGFRVEPQGCQGFWRDFPTEPPVRSRDDGLSPGMADLAIPWTKWRTESIKALGNAIVPQVLYEIFRAIEMEEDNGKHRHTGS